MSARRAENCGATQQFGGRYDELIAFHAGFDRYRIASARGADRRHVNGRRAVLANYVRPVLIIALMAADGASVESSCERLVGAADDDHAHRYAIGFDRETVQVAIVDRGYGDAHEAVHCRNGDGGRERT